MSTPAPLTQSEQDLIGQVARFTEQRGQNGVYMVNGMSKSLGLPICFICAIGEQALALNDIIMAAQARQSPIDIVTNINDITGGGF